VLVPRGDDDGVCLRVLEQLYRLVEGNPGDDGLELVVRDKAGLPVELAGAGILVRHSADLQSQVIGLVGADNVAEVSG
jgi:hypothetical protein